MIHDRIAKGFTLQSLSYGPELIQSHGTVNLTILSPVDKGGNRLDAIFGELDNAGTGLLESTLLAPEIRFWKRRKNTGEGQGLTMKEP